MLRDLLTQKWSQKVWFLILYSLCRLALFTLCSAATWWLKRHQPVSAPLVASRLNGRRRATLSQTFQKTPQFIT
jgi:hypothetical protein